MIETTEIKMQMNIISSKEEIDKSFKKVLYDLPKASDLHFKILMHKYWKIVDINIDELSESHPVTTLALFKRYIEPRCEIQVDAHLVPRDIHPLHYLEMMVLKEGFTIEDKKVFPHSSGITGDFLCSKVMEGIVYYYRKTIFKNDNVLFVIDCRSEKLFYKKVEEEYLAFIRSFKLVNMDRKIFAEPHIAYKFDAPIRTKFLFPKSWLYKKNFSKKDGISEFRFINLKKIRPIGTINMAIFSKSERYSCVSIFQEYLLQLRNKEFKIEGNEIKQKIPSNFINHWFEMFACSKKKVKYDLVVSVIETQFSWHLVALIGVDMKSDFTSWAFNRKAYTNLLETLEIG